jgi:hypothetical protein
MDGPDGEAAGNKGVVAVEEDPMTKPKPSDAKVMLQLALEKQRLCYWLIRMIQASGWTGDVEEGARRCLVDVGYNPRSQLARNLIEHGEPGVPTRVVKGA